MAENKPQPQPQRGSPPPTPPAGASAPPGTGTERPTPPRTPTARVSTGGRNFQVKHQMLGAFEQGRIVSEKMLNEMGYDIARALRLGAIAETDQSVTENPVAPGPDNPNAVGGGVSDGSHHPENQGELHGTPNKPPHPDNTPAGTQGLSTRTGMRQVDTGTPSRKTGAGPVEEEK